jgi:site-specific recombinase XerD
MLHQPYVRTKLKEAAALAGVDKRVCCHQWRHAHARHLRKMGVSLEAVQQQLGHSNVATTSIYVSVLESGDIHRMTRPAPIATAPASPSTAG